MFSNLLARLNPGAAQPRKADAAHPPAEEVAEAGGANAYLAQAVQFVAPVTFAPRRGGKDTQRTARANEQLLFAAERQAVPAAVAPLWFPVGLVSGDGLGRLGYEGFVLPTEGGSPPERYFADPSSITLDATVARWRDVLMRRADGLAQLGVGFAGTVLPDKLTLLADYFPEPVAVPAPLTAALEFAVSEQLGLAGAVDSVLPALRADPAMKDIYRRIDPVLTPYGAWRLFQLLIARLGLSVGIGVNFAQRKLVRPMMADRFFDMPFFEEIFETDSVVVMRAAAGVVAKPSPPGFEGWHVWRNEMAPVNQTLVLWGDPLIGVAEHGQGAPAWWFSCFFREVHVSHSNKYDHGYVTDFHPDSAIFVHTEEGLESPPLA